MSDTPAAGIDARTLRWLKVLVFTMTITFIAGFVIIVGLFIAKFDAISVSPTQTFPGQIALPDGTAAQSFTATDRWYAVVTENNEILIFDRVTHTLIQRVEIISE